MRRVKQIVHVSPAEQVRCVLAVTAVLWQVSGPPVRDAAVRVTPLHNKRSAAPGKSPLLDDAAPPDRDRLEDALAQSWRWAV